MLRLTVEFWGPARDLAQADATTFVLQDGASVGDLRRVLARRYPRMEERMRFMRFAVNEEFAVDSRSLNADDVVAVIPPVSGG